MSGRQLLRDALTAALPSWQIVADPRVIDTVRKPGALVLYPEKVVRPSKWGLDYVMDEMVLWVLTASDDPSKLEDDLDGLLLSVMEVLEPLEAFVWTEATRGVLSEKFNGWRFTLTCLYKITPETP